jgi:geranyl diphosphate synthase
MDDANNLLSIISYPQYVHTHTHIIIGEIMQARAKKEDALDMKYYLRKSYFKTASLICSSCKSAALLSGHLETDDYTKAAEQYGYHLGMAYQIVDDILDFTGASASLGKPAQADMQLGLATAPILIASQSIKELKPLIERKFKEKGDVQMAIKYALTTDCIAKSYDLAEFHAQCAVDALSVLPSSESRSALYKLLHVAISRDK